MLKRCLMVSAFLLPTPAEAVDDFTCRNDQGDAVRIDMETDNPETGLPCWVVFWPKPDEHRIIWRAERSRDFCVDKVREMIDRFTVNGLVCAETPAFKRFDAPFFPKEVM